MNSKVWYVTGASKGLGLSLVKKLLAGGHRVAATSRNLADLQQAAGESENLLPLTVNLTDETSVSRSIAATIDRFGKIDVVVNNAGYGVIGALEELTDAESRANFDVNVFGSLNVIRHALPHLRAAGSGHIYNIASIGGFNGGFPGFGIYCATKFAVHGFTEGLAHEIREFGLHATVIMPGYFRTNFLEGSSLATPRTEIAEYTKVRETQQAHTHQINDNQPGDPDKAADVMIALSEMPEPPIHVFLGQDAYQLADSKIAAVKKDMEAVRKIATATAFDQKPA